MNNGHENGRLLRGVRPIGQLEETLQRYEAPEDTQRRIARRVGILIDHGIPIKVVEEKIQKSMQVGGDGMPKWPLVEHLISKEAHGVYHGDGNRNGNGNGASEGVVFSRPVSRVRRNTDQGRPVKPNRVFSGR